MGSNESAGSCGVHLRSERCRWRQPAAGQCHSRRPGRRPAPLARTTATPTAVVSGTARTSPIEPTRMLKHLGCEPLGHATRRAVVGY